MKKDQYYQMAEDAVSIFICGEYYYLHPETFARMCQLLTRAVMHCAGDELFRDNMPYTNWFKYGIEFLAGPMPPDPDTPSDLNIDLEDQRLMEESFEQFVQALQIWQRRLIPNIRHAQNGVPVRCWPRGTDDFCRTFMEAVIYPVKGDPVEIDEKTPRKSLSELIFSKDQIINGTVYNPEVFKHFLYVINSHNTKSELFPDWMREHWEEIKERMNEIENPDNLPF